MFSAVILAALIYAAQDTEASSVYIGGSVSANQDNSGYYIDASPLIGYRQGILDVGGSPFYSYSDRNDRQRRTYGGRAFTQITFYPNIYAHGEVQLTNMGRRNDEDDRRWILAFPVGAGYRYSINSRTKAYAMVLYDLALEDDSPSMNPMFRTGITYRF